MAAPVFFVVFQSQGAKQDWRWRMYAAGSRLVAVSGDGYAEKAACVEAVNLLSGLAACAVIRYAA